MKVKMRLYLDTSVFEGLADEEFKEDTAILLDYIAKYGIEVIYSNLRCEELEEVPESVRKVLTALPNVSYIRPSKKAIALAKMYVKAGVLRNKYLEEAYHVAVATIEKASVIVSWNFSNVIQFEKMHQYASVNYREGYQFLPSFSPWSTIGSIEAETDDDYAHKAKSTPGFEAMGWLKQVREEGAQHKRSLINPLEGHRRGVKANHMSR